MKTEKKYLSNDDLLNKNPGIDRKLIEESTKLQEEAKKFGHEIKSGYSLTPPLGDQLLFTRAKKLSTNLNECKVI